MYIKNPEHIMTYKSTSPLLLFLNVCQPHLKRGECCVRQLVDSILVKQTTKLTHTSTGIYVFIN